MSVFYMSSVDYSKLMPGVYSCEFVERLQSETRDDLMLIKAQPPISIDGQSQEMVILAKRHSGATLYPPHPWPVCVHVMRIPEGWSFKCGDMVKDSDLRSWAWAEIYPTEELARQKNIFM